jgi:branched-chain amino acid transport system permease protein
MEKRLDSTSSAWARAAGLASGHGTLWLILFLALFPFIVPYEALGTQILIYGLFAMGYNIILGFTGLLSFGHAAFFGLGAYGAGLALTRLGLGLLSGIGAGVLCATAGAMGIGALCLKRRGIYFGMLTLAFAQLLYFLALVVFAGYTGGDDGLRNIPTLPVSLPGGVSFSIDSPLRFYYFVFVFCVVSILVMRRILDSPFGAVLQAIRENEKRAKSCGYNTTRVKWFAFLLSGIFSGLAGALYASYYHLAPLSTLYWTTSGSVVMMTILGGMGTFFGPFVGAGVFLIIEDVISVFTKSWPLFVGAIFMCFVLFFPQGIWGTLEEWTRSRRARRKVAPLREGS